MKQSELFTKTRKEAPSDEVAVNAQLLIRGGFVHKEVAGVYDFLPLGHIVRNRICDIIREEMHALGAYELSLSTLQEKELWETTDRWSDEKVDNWFKTVLKNGSEVGLGFTHEEPITRLMKNHIRSYKDLPIYAYQIQTKFRNEARAKSGIMRGREFLMKDMYSFSRSDEEHNAFYERSKEAYLNVFRRAGIADCTYLTFASGGVFSKYSHEFQMVCESGEDTIYVDEEKGIAVNKEVLTDAVLSELGLSREGLVEKKAIEVGNIFSLGTRFSEALGLTFKDEADEVANVVMGSYGLGPDRLMGAVVEALHDDKGIVWPREIAPFDTHLIVINPNNDTVVARGADEIYDVLTTRGERVLMDDRGVRAGEKFADADLIGIPRRIVVSEKTLAAGTYEVCSRSDGAVEHVDKDAL